MGPSHRASALGLRIHINGNYFLTRVHIHIFLQLFPVLTIITFLCFMLLDWSDQLSQMPYQMPYSRESEMEVPSEMTLHLFHPLQVHPTQFIISLSVA
jgi:hypothetical protein